MGVLGQMGDMYKLQKEAKKIKKELATIHVFAEANGVKVTVNCEQEVISVEFQEGADMSNSKNLAKGVMDATNRAVKKSQQVAAEKMKAIMGGFPGMGGK